MDLQQIWTNIVDYITNSQQVTAIIRVAVIIVITLIALRLSRILTRRIFQTIFKEDIEGEVKKRADTLSSLIRYTLNVVIMVVAFVMILGEFGVEIGPILAAAGIVGVAVGFGSQQLVQDVISGFFILLEDMIRVGDVVQIAGKGGLVEKVNLRMVILRDLAGNVHYVRNGHIDVITNMTKEYSRYVFDIGIAYRENTDEVVEVIKEVDEDMRNDETYKNDILEPIEILGVDQFADSAVIIKARTKTKPIKQWSVAREFNRRLKIAFDEKNIEIPFPHVTLYMGEEKEGGAPPMHVKMMNGAKQQEASAE